MATGTMKMVEYCCNSEIQLSLEDSGDETDGVG